jgi:hypothetical protein
MLHRDYDARYAYRFSLFIRPSRLNEDGSILSGFACDIENRGRTLLGKKLLDGLTELIALDAFLTTRFDFGARHLVRRDLCQ